MSALSLNCPNCRKAMKAPAEAIGKRVRCRACAHVFTVSDDDGAPSPKDATVKPLPSESRKPTPGKAKPAVEPKPDTGPIGLAKEQNSDDDDDGPAEYGVTEDDDTPRCPRCAKDLDPPDTKICLECGFDLVNRVRHRTKKVFETSKQDVFLYWLPAIIWIIVLLAGLGCVIWGWLSMTQIWTENELLLSDDKNALTDKKQFLVDPNACNVCLSVMLLALFSFGVPVVFKRIKSPMPPEIEKRK